MQTDTIKNYGTVRAAVERDLKFSLGRYDRGDGPLTLADGTKLMRVDLIYMDGQKFRKICDELIKKGDTNSKQTAAELLRWRDHVTIKCHRELGIHDFSIAGGGLNDSWGGGGGGWSDGGGGYINCNDNPHCSVEIMH